MIRSVTLSTAAWLFVALACYAEVDPAVLEAEQARIDIIAKAEPSVLAIFGADGTDGGSGVVISPDGYALSNFHVTVGAGVAMKCGMADGQLYDAVIVGIDPTGDVALLKLLGRDDFPVAPLGDSDRVRMGDWVFAMGNPFLLAADFRPTLTYGIVSGVHRYQYPSGTLLEYTDCIQTDASINPGNSGGPLFNLDGELIGINGRGSFEKRGRVNVGVGYAISINQIKNFLGHLRSGRIVDHATLGATVRTERDGRVIVTDVLDDSDAWRRGLRPGDEILRFGGRVIHSANSLKNVLGIFPDGWRVPLTYVQRGQRRDVYVRLESVHREGELARRISGRRMRIETPQPDDEEPESEPEQPGGPDDDAQPEQDADHPHRSGEADNLPEIVAKHYERRHGYANYFFNRQRRQQLLEALMARGNYSSMSGVWLIEGVLAGDEPFVVNLDREQGRISLPAGDVVIADANDLNQAVEPPGSGGLLPALYLWRRLVADGPESLDEVFYLGSAPLPQRDGLFEVLVVVHAGAECRFLIDPGTDELVAIEFYPADDVDPCEVYFSEYEEFEGRALPGRIDVRHGDADYGVFDARLYSIGAETAVP